MQEQSEPVHATCLSGTTELQDKKRRAEESKQSILESCKLKEAEAVGY